MVYGVHFVSVACLAHTVWIGRIDHLGGETSIIPIRNRLDRSALAAEGTPWHDTAALAMAHARLHVAAVGSFGIKQRSELGDKRLMEGVHDLELRGIAPVDVLRAAVPARIEWLAAVGGEPDEVSLPAVVCGSFSAVSDPL